MASSAVAKPGGAGGSGGWLFGPGPDLLFGCGLWYVLAFGLFVVAGADIRESAVRNILMPLLVLFFGVPHYGATLVRVYERAEDRRGYAIFAVWITLVIAAAFVVGVYNIAVGSWILTLYLTWSPWHYTGQNYGLAVMFLRRRGIELSPGIKRVVYASFLLSFVMTLLAVHSGGSADSYTPVPHESDSYRFINLGIPLVFANPAFGVAAAAYVAAVVASVVLLLRRASLRAFLPAGALMLAQALWFSVPLALRKWSFDTGIEPWESKDGPYYFMWIAVAHSVQYIWVTSYYAKNSGRWSGQLPYYGKVLLAGSLIWTGPAVLFAPELLGRVSFGAGLGLLVASAVNIHHFVLDGAIWKLRSGRIAQVLIRSRQGAPASIEPEAIGWLGRAALVAGAACFVLSVAATFEWEYGVRRSIEQGNTWRARQAAERLAWMGREGPQLRLALAQALERGGNPGGAHEQYRKAIELHPTAENWHAFGAFLMRGRQWEPAAISFEAALELAPDEPALLHQLGLARLELGDAEGAREAFARAEELEPETTRHRSMRERAERELVRAAAHGSEG